MSALTMPSAGVRDIAWRFEDQDLQTRSVITGRTRTTEIGQPRFSARVSVALRVGADIRPWRAFFTALRGRRGTFLLPAIKAGEQADITPALIAATTGWPAGGEQIGSAGWGRSGVETVAPAGAVFSHAGRLHVLTAAAQTDAVDPNVAILTFRPRLAAASVNATPIDFQAPVGTMRLAGNVTGWEDLLSNYQPFAFECEEAF